jgi:epoxyqueuosine reductase
MTLAGRIKARARELGFDLVGVAPAKPITTVDRYQAWLEGGYHGQMAYLARPEAVARRGDLTRVLPGVRSVVAVGVNYHTVPLPAEQRDDPSRGIMASYAWGDDYHDGSSNRKRVTRGPTGPTWTPARCWSGRSPSTPDWDLWARTLT